MAPSGSAAYGWRLSMCEPTGRTLGSFGPGEVLAGMGLTLPGITRVIFSPHAACEASDHSSERCEVRVRRVPIPLRVLFGVDPWTSHP
jgi:hypothetical protein